MNDFDVKKERRQNEIMVELKLISTAQSSSSSLPTPTVILPSCSFFPKNFPFLAQWQTKEGKLLKPALSLGLPSRKWIQTFTVQRNCRLSLDKANISVLVLVPLIAFCIGCVVRALHSRVTKNLRHRSANISRQHHSASNSMRWRAVLELTDPDSLNAESESNSGYISEGQEQMHLDISQDNAKLEEDYQKFLSECGMSEWGYFRGGSSE